MRPPRSFPAWTYGWTTLTRTSELAYLLFLEELLGPEWVECWARKRGKLDALREWRKVAQCS